MANLTAKYEELGRGEGEAPSGQHFKWRSPTVAEYGALTGAVPGLLSTNEGKAEESFEKVNDFNLRLAKACVTYPLIVDDAPAEDVDYIFASALRQMDLNWLAPRILAASGLDSKKADDNRRAL
jgi:hypothetical protein